MRVGLLFFTTETVVVLNAMLAQGEGSSYSKRFEYRSAWYWGGNFETIVLVASFTFLFILFVGVHFDRCLALLHLFLWLYAQFFMVFLWLLLRWIYARS